tara:strand:+ start:284 stop:781 length:498 start_codon:yes stop_codon:yes gene_type:complete
MTKKLEEIFDLEPKQSEDTKIDVSEPLPVKADIPTETLSNIEKIENALPRVKGLEAGDGEMDELAEIAQKSYKDLMDLGMNVDSRFSAEIFSVASNLLNHAISAKTAKINKKLKMVDLQLKQAQLEQKQRALAVKQGEDVQQGEGVVMDRNELLQELLKKEPPKE